MRCGCSPQASRSSLSMPFTRSGCRESTLAWAWSQGPPSSRFGERAAGTSPFGIEIKNGVRPVHASRGRHQCRRPERLRGTYPRVFLALRELYDTEKRHARENTLHLTYNYANYLYYEYEAGGGANNVLSMLHHHLQSQHGSRRPKILKMGARARTITSPPWGTLRGSPQLANSRWW